MANPKWNYRVKRYLNSIPKIKPSEKVEIPETVEYGSLLVLCNAHNITFKPEERYTLAKVEKENERTGTITILSGKNAGYVYEHVPYVGGFFHFNEYKGDSYFGLNFNRNQADKDKLEKTTEFSVKNAIQKVEEQNKMAVKAARDLLNQIYNRPEY